MDLVFYNTYFDRELLRRAILILDREKIDYRIMDRSHPGTSRAPLSGYFEADLQIATTDFERAEFLLNPENYS